MPDALIIFVRNPESGKVKTRLAATVGAEKALEIYRQLLNHTLAITIEIAAEKYVFYAGTIAETDIWQKAGYHQRLQKESDLGEKMQNAFETLFNNKHSKVIIIGSDCIELSETIICEAFYELNKNDVVIGPANDGGYYLLGMKGMHADFFVNKQWSTETVYQTTILDFKTLGLQYRELPMLIDIDTEEDWNQSQQK